jgi:hypothetical protein
MSARANVTRMTEADAGELLRGLHRPGANYGVFGVLAVAWLMADGYLDSAGVTEKGRAAMAGEATDG